MHVVNVLFRSLVLATGIVIALGIGPASNAPSPFREVFGSVVALFGLYRLITYFTALNRSSE